MQFFPADITIPEGAGANSAFLSVKKNGSEEDFGNMFSSFIEDERYDYSGRPAGFAAYGTESGTIDYDTAARIAKELRQRKVSEISVGQFEAMAASGAPMTIGTVYTTLSGKGRLTDSLGDAERESFRLVLDKLGFSKTETEDMLGLSDDGDSAGMWKLLSGKLQALEGTADVSRKEWNALLRGLDVSGVNRDSLLRLFQGDSGELEMRELSGADLEKMLSAVRGEYAEREQAASFARTQARNAITASFAAARIERDNAAVDDARGTRLLEQKEELMQNSVRKHTGVDQIKDAAKDATDGDPASQEAGHEDGRGFEGSGKNRSERILATHEDYAAERKDVGSEQPKTARTADDLLRNIHAAPDAARPGQATVPQAQNLNTMARQHRQEIFSQVEQGILSGTHNGSSRLTLQLNPAELGQVTVILSMHQGEMKATIRADRQESAEALREQMAELKTALETEGIKVKELDVQTGLNEDPAAAWDGHEEHNLMRDADERDRMLRLARIRRDAAGEAGRGESPEQADPLREKAGLHVVA